MHVFACEYVGLVVTLGGLWCVVCSYLGLMVIHAGRRGGKTDRKPEDHAVTELLYHRDIRLGPLQPAACSLVMQFVCIVAIVSEEVFLIFLFLPNG